MDEMLLVWEWVRANPVEFLFGSMFFGWLLWFLMGFFWNDWEGGSHGRDE